MRWPFNLGFFGLPDQFNALHRHLPDSIIIKMPLADNLAPGQQSPWFPIMVVDLDDDLGPWQYFEWFRRAPKRPTYLIVISGNYKFRGDILAEMKPTHFLDRKDVPQKFAAVLLGLSMVCEVQNKWLDMFLENYHDANLASDIHAKTEPGKKHLLSLCEMLAELMVERVQTFFYVRHKEYTAYLDSACKPVDDEMKSTLEKKLRNVTNQLSDDDPFRYEKHLRRPSYTQQLIHTSTATLQVVMFPPKSWKFETCSTLLSCLSIAAPVIRSAWRKLFQVRNAWLAGQLDAFMNFSEGISHELSRITQTSSQPEGDTHKQVAALQKIIDFRLDYMNQLEEDLYWRRLRAHDVSELWHQICKWDDKDCLEIVKQEKELTIAGQHIVGEVFRFISHWGLRDKYEGKVHFSSYDDPKGLRIYIWLDAEPPAKAVMDSLFTGFVRDYPESRLFEMHHILQLVGGTIRILEREDLGFFLRIPDSIPTIAKLPVNWWKE